ncbi:MAG TPA: isochorismatase family cysteine hydrolase, partial [Candidatus Binatus sp.]|nr:isochorismatase family cysteine hydrolase [Candidatus Binatus sp.]
MLEFAGRQIPNELREIVDPKKTILLVWDMQNDQAGGSFNKDALIRNAPPLIAAAAKVGIKTVYTRQTPFLWEDEAVTWIRRAMINEKVDHPSKLKSRRLHGSFGWNILEPFKPGPDDAVIDKRRPSMFIGNEFETIMHNRGATTV